MMKKKRTRVWRREKKENEGKEAEQKWMGFSSVTPVSLSVESEVAAVVLRLKRARKIFLFFSLFLQENGEKKAKEFLLPNPQHITAIRADCGLTVTPEIIK